MGKEIATGIASTLERQSSCTFCFSLSGTLHITRREPRNCLFLLVPLVAPHGEDWLFHQSFLFMFDRTELSFCFANVDLDFNQSFRELSLFTKNSFQNLWNILFCHTITALYFERKQKNAEESCRRCKWGLTVSDESPVSTSGRRKIDADPTGGNMEIRNLSSHSCRETFYGDLLRNHWSTFPGSLRC